MIDQLDQLKAWLKAKEDEYLEFKEAKSNFEFETLVKYCAALANEGGGRVILGVTDKQPRRVVGSQAFREIERTKAGLIERLRLRVEADELAHPDGRVVVFTIPSRPLGVPIGYRGSYWMRGGQDLVPMTPDRLKRIFDEVGLDFSAEACSRATLADLDPRAIERFRALWRRKSGIETLESASVQQLLSDAELLVEGKVTNAALVLLGTREALGKYLGQAEVIFEYRSSEAPGPAQQRVEYRIGALLFLDELWNVVNLRNDAQHFQDGLYIWDVPTFSEAASREAFLNAIAHRDYRDVGSVFVRQYPRRLEIVSPGGFLPGITSENFLWKQAPRNRRIAETFSKCGLVDRAGQGADRMLKACILESKPRPDLSGTDDYQVWLTLHGEVQDQRFLRFLEKLGPDRLGTITTADLLVLDLVHRDQPIPSDLRVHLAPWVEQGVIERVGQGRGASYLLSRQLYGFLGETGAYTRRRGLDRETNKALLLKHLEDSRDEGCPFRELTQVLPALSRRQVQRLLQSLRAEGKACLEGQTSHSRWHAEDTRARNPR